MTLKPEELAGYIDHTILKADASSEDVKRLCREAAEYNFASVCINPYFVKLTAEQLKESSAKACTVIDFPLGAAPAETKIAGAIKAVADGAGEIDMVINISAVKEANFLTAEKEIRYVKESVPSHIILKVILETCYLTAEEIRTASKISLNAGADFIKTSTGFGTGGATVEAVNIMAEVANGKIGVKASGGIRDYEKTIEMINAGATRIGTSSGLKIIGVQ